MQSFAVICDDVVATATLRIAAAAAAAAAVVTILVVIIQLDAHLCASQYAK
jgi:hypothetical protein